MSLINNGTTVVAEKLNAHNNLIIEEIEADYKRRQGNLVLSLAKFIKPELFERKPYKIYKSNDDFLKRRLNICRRSVDRACKKFMNSFGRDRCIKQHLFFCIKKPCTSLCQHHVNINRVNIEFCVNIKNKVRVNISISRVNI